MFGILRLLDRLDVDPALILVAILCVCEVDWSALDNRNWFPYEYRDGMRIVIKTGVPLKRVLLAGSEECYEGRDEVCSFYCKGFESRGMTQEVARAAWLRYVSDGFDYHELLTLGAQVLLLNSPQSPARSAGGEVNANAATNVAESLIDAVPDDNNERNMEHAFVLDALERVGVKK